MTHNFTATESLAKRSDLHLLRKLWHIACGLTGLILYTILPFEFKTWGYFALGISFIGFAIDFLRLRNKKFNILTLKVLGPLMRNSEKDSFSGLPFYALGVGISILFFKKEIALISILFLVVADPLSSLVGVLFGKNKILPNKSLEGTLAGYIASFILVLFFLLSSSEVSINLILFSLLAALIGSMSELMSAFNIDDNLTIPVVSGAGMSFLNLFFNII